MLLQQDKHKLLLALFKIYLITIIVITSHTFYSIRSNCFKECHDFELHTPEYNLNSKALYSFNLMFIKPFYKLDSKKPQKSIFLAINVKAN